MNAENMATASRCRADIKRLTEKVKQLSNNVMAPRSLVKGTIYENKKKCGNPLCRCATAGYRHSTRLLSFSHQGKTHIISLGKYSKTELSKLEKQVQEYQSFRKARAEIVSTMETLVEQINELERVIVVDIESIRKRGKNG